MLFWSNKMNQRSVPPPFLTKTYSLVEDRSSDDVISWSEDGSTFVIWKTAEFAKLLLPNYFKHNNFSSFVRQLNTYGFRKIAQNKWEFANENFKRGQEHLLAAINRRKLVHPQYAPAPKLESAGKITSPANSGELGSTSTCSLEAQETALFSDLSWENEKLKKSNMFLTSELAKAKSQCDELVAFMTRYLKQAPGRSINFCKPPAPTERGDGSEISDGDDDKNETCVKLFGVVMKKRGVPFEDMDLCGSPRKQVRRESADL